MDGLKFENGLANVIAGCAAAGAVLAGVYMNNTYPHMLSNDERREINTKMLKAHVCLERARVELKALVDGFNGNAPAKSQQLSDG